MSPFNFRKYNATIKVLFPDNNRMRDPVYPNEVRYLPGYFRSVSVYASSEGDAVAELGGLLRMVGSIGHVPILLKYKQRGETAFA